MEFENLDLDNIIEDDNYIHIVSQGLASEQREVRIQVYNLLIALCQLSETGHARVLEIFDHNKVNYASKIRFHGLIDKLRVEVSSENPINTEDENLAILNLIYSILERDHAQTYKKIILENEFIGLKLPYTLDYIKLHNHNSNMTELISRIQDQLSCYDYKSFLEHIDINSPFQLFNSILRGVAGTPNEIAFLTILRNLMLLRLNEDSSDPSHDIYFHGTDEYREDGHIIPQPYAKGGDSSRKNNSDRTSKIWECIEKAVISLCLAQPEDRGEPDKFLQKLNLILEGDHRSVNLKDKDLFDRPHPIMAGVPCQDRCQCRCHSNLSFPDASNENYDDGLMISNPNDDGDFSTEKNLCLTVDRLSATPPAPPLPSRSSRSVCNSSSNVEQHSSAVYIPPPPPLPIPCQLNSLNRSQLGNLLSASPVLPLAKVDFSVVEDKTFDSLPKFTITSSTFPPPTPSLSLFNQKYPHNIPVVHVAPLHQSINPLGSSYGVVAHPAVSQQPLFQTARGDCPRSPLAQKSAQESLPQLMTPVPKAKLKTLNWIRIPLMKILASSSTENVWMSSKFKRKNLAEHYNINFTYLEQLFTMPTNPSYDNDFGKPSDSGKRKSYCGFLDSSSTHGTNNRRLSVYSNASYLSEFRRQEILLLEPKRNLNVSIYLRQFKNGFEDIIENLRYGKGSKIGVDKLRGLIKVLPEPYEVELLQSFNDNFERLGVAEKFFIKLLQLPNYQLRVEGLLLKEDFINNLDEILPALDSIIYTAQDIKNCTILHEILLLTVYIGNFINSGGYAGNAAGIKLSSLLKITEIRGNNPKIGLIHFVAEHLKGLNIQVTKLISDLKYLEKAQKLSLETLTMDISSLTTKCGNLSSQVDKADGDVKYMLEDFLRYAKQEMESIHKDLNEIEKWRGNLADFFCEDRETFKLEECFKIFHVFLERLKRADAENAARKIAEDKKKILNIGGEAPGLHNTANLNDNSDGLVNQDSKLLKDKILLRRYLLPKEEIYASDFKGSESSSIFTEQDNDSLRSCSSPGSYKRRIRSGSRKGNGCEKLYQPSSSEDLMEYLSNPCPIPKEEIVEQPKSSLYRKRVPRNLSRAKRYAQTNLNNGKSVLRQVTEDYRDSSCASDKMTTINDLLHQSANVSDLSEPKLGISQEQVTSKILESIKHDIDNEKLLYPLPYETNGNLNEKSTHPFGNSGDNSTAIPPPLDNPLKFVQREDSCLKLLNEGNQRINSTPKVTYIRENVNYQGNTTSSMYPSNQQTTTYYSQRDSGFIDQNGQDDYQNTFTISYNCDNDPRLQNHIQSTPTARIPNNDSISLKSDVIKPSNYETKGKAALIEDSRSRNVSNANKPINVKSEKLSDLEFRDFYKQVLLNKEKRESVVDPKHLNHSKKIGLKTEKCSPGGNKKNNQTSTTLVSRNAKTISTNGPKKCELHLSNKPLQQDTQIKNKISGTHTKLGEYKGKSNAPSPKNSDDNPDKKIKNYTPRINSLTKLGNVRKNSPIGSQISVHSTASKDSNSTSSNGTASNLKATKNNEKHVKSNTMCTNVQQPTELAKKKNSLVTVRPYTKHISVTITYGDNDKKVSSQNLNDGPANSFNHKNASKTTIKSENSSSTFSRSSPPNLSKAKKLEPKRTFPDINNNNVVVKNERLNVNHRLSSISCRPNNTSSKANSNTLFASAPKQSLVCTK